MPTYSLAQLSSLIYDELDNNVGLYPQAQVTAVLNEGLCKINNLVAFQQANIPIFTTPNQLVYTMPSGVLIPTKVYFEGVEIQKVSMRELGTTHRDWAIEASSAYGAPSRWAPIGQATFVLNPMDSIGGRLLEIQGTGPVTFLVNAGDTVSLDDDMVATLVDWGQGRIQLKLGGRPFANASLSYQRFIREVRDDIMFDEMQWPSYFLDRELEPAEGKESGN
jgi:hypothetical protein